MRDDNKAEVAKFQQMVDDREKEIQTHQDRLNNLSSTNDLLTVERDSLRADVAAMNAEMEQKSQENNRLRKQCADIEKAMQDLYRSRKGPGSL